MTFDEWLDSIPEAERSQLILADAWNAGLEAGCIHFGEMEGVDYGAFDELSVPTAWQPK